MRGQIGSVDAVISLSVLAAMVVLWTQMFLDASPIFQAYTYRATLDYGYHMVNKLLYDINAPWICKTPNDIPVPVCIAKGASISANDLGKSDLNLACRISCSPVAVPLTGCSDTYPASGGPPKVVIPFRACVGEWNSCTVTECNLGVWHA